MTKKGPLTVESLAEIITTEGLGAAKQAIDQEKQGLVIEESSLKKQIEDLSNKLAENEKRISQFDTLLIGAVKKAAADADIHLAAPAAKAALKLGGKRHMPSAQERQEIFAEIKRLVKGKDAGQINKAQIGRDLEAKGLRISPQPLSDWINYALEGKELPVIRRGRPAKE